MSYIITYIISHHIKRRQPNNGGHTEKNGRRQNKNMVNTEKRGMLIGEGTL
jgi:hypothetical protein